MKIDSKKLERQELGVNTWFKAGKRGTLHYFTGVGKTFTAVLIIKALFRKDDIHNIVVIVPSEELVNQWNDVLSKSFTKKQLTLISVFTPNYVLVNDLRVQTNTIIADELHEYVSDEFFKVINGEYIRFDNTLGLTATYKDSKGRHTILQELYPIIDEITEEEALKEGYIAPYVEFNLSVRLTQEEQDKYKAYSKLISKGISKFGKGGFGLAAKCLSGGYHGGKKYKGSHFVWGWAVYNGYNTNLDLNNPLHASINEMWNPNKIFGYASSLLNNTRKRKDLLYNAINKLEVSKELFFKFSDLKAIVFSQSTAFADKLDLTLNLTEPNSSVVYHSKLQTRLLPSPKTGKLIKFGAGRLKKLAISSIKSGKARGICTASSLDKGFDVQDVVLGITASGTSNFTQYKQRGGRVKRIDMFNPSKTALLVNLYVKDTKDEVWLKKRQSESSHKIYWVDSIDEVNFNPVDKEEFSIDDM
jgi:superfamily II DNA or RNA helicase